MRLSSIGLGLLAAFALGAPGARAQGALNVPTLDRSFVCPETLDRDQNPARPLPTFMESVARAAPGASDTAVRLYWRQLLVQHACARSLDQIRAKEEAVHAGAVEPQAWMPAGGDSKVSLAVSEDFLEPYTDPRDTDTPAIETYVRAAFATPRRTDISGLTYDEVVSHVIYYCDVSERALIENVYLLSGRVMRTEPHAPTATVSGVGVYDTVPVSPGSLNAIGLNWVCAGFQPPA